MCFCILFLKFAMATSSISPVDAYSAEHEKLFNSLSSSNRILIFGIPGGGKSTLSVAMKQYREYAGQPAELLHLDKVKFVEDALYKNALLKMYAQKLWTGQQNRRGLLRGTF
jgi:hypothetical protein